MNHISNNKHKHEWFVKENDLIEQKNYEFYDDIYDNIDHENQNDDEKRKIRWWRKWKQNDFDDDIMIFN